MVLGTRELLGRMDGRGIRYEGPMSLSVIAEFLFSYLRKSDRCIADYKQLGPERPQKVLTVL